MNILLDKKIRQNSSVRQVASLIFRFGDNKMSMSKPYVALRLLFWCPSNLKMVIEYIGKGRKNKYKEYVVQFISITEEA